MLTLENKTQEKNASFCRLFQANLSYCLFSYSYNQDIPGVLGCFLRFIGAAAIFSLIDKHKIKSLDRFLTGVICQSIRLNFV